jgi:5-oxoprolinase (ATP-hydrolysing)
VHEVQQPCAFDLGINTLDEVKSRFAHLNALSKCALETQGFLSENIHYESYLNLRYDGTDCALMILKPADSWNFKETFVDQYKSEFGFTLPDRKIIVDDARVRAIGKSHATGVNKDRQSVHSELKTLIQKEAPPAGKFVSTFWESLGRVVTPIYELPNLPVGSKIVGPAILIDQNATIAIEPFCSAIITSEHVVGYLNDSISADIGTQMDPIMLSIFGHRFMSIAEQMGRTLQKTSVSTNIKERLDFSCALFGPDGF